MHQLWIWIIRYRSAGMCDSFTSKIHLHGILVWNSSASHNLIIVWNWRLQLTWWEILMKYSKQDKFVHCVDEYRKSVTLNVSVNSQRCYHDFVRQNSISQIKIFFFTFSNARECKGKALALPQIEHFQCVYRFSNLSRKVFSADIALSIEIIYLMLCNVHF